MMDIALFLSVDLPALLALLAAAMAAALVGNFLILQRQSLLGDALAHAVLPGIVLGFTLSQSRELLPLLLGASASALAATALVEFIRRSARIEPQAILGVVYTSCFALGILLIAQSGARTIHLDADAVLYGQIENVLWPALQSWRDLLRLDVWLQMPRELTQLWGVLLIAAVAVRLLYKEFLLLSFDTAYGTSLGLSLGTIRVIFMVLVALVTIAAFEVVGSILIVALLTVPAATARLVTHRLPAQICLSLIFAALAAVIGYPLAAWVPLALGASAALNAGAMVAVVSGVILTLVIACRPRRNG